MSDVGLGAKPLRRILGARVGVIRLVEPSRDPLEEMMSDFSLGELA